MAHVMNNTKLSSLDDLFKSSGVGSDNHRNIVEIPLSELHEFKGHPFRVLDDENMALLVESVKDNGVMQPGVARRDPDGGYEIVEGHRRKHACETAGLKTMPFYLMELDDDTATAYMAASNLTQRKDFLISEKAWAYRKLTDALKHQGKKGMNTALQISEESGDSESTVKRLIRLTYLIPELMELVDTKKLGLDPGKSISYLTKKEQKMVLAIILAGNIGVSAEQGQKLRDASEKKTLTEALAEEILSKEQKRKKRSFSMKEDILDGYFTPDYSNEEIQNIIIGLLNNWKAVNG